MVPITERPRSLPQLGPHASQPKARVVWRVSVSVWFSVLGPVEGGGPWWQTPEKCFTPVPQLPLSARGGPLANPSPLFPCTPSLAIFVCNFSTS